MLNCKCGGGDTDLPLGFGRADDGDLALSLGVLGLVLVDGGDLDTGAGKANDVADVGAFGADDGTDGVVGDVEVRGFLCVPGALRRTRLVHARVRRLP